MAGTTPISGSTSSQPAQLSGGSNQQLGASQFLQLLTTELQNQDPMSPMDDTQSVAQLAQFSALQAQEQLNASFQNFQSNFSVLQSSALIGKQVTVNTASSSSSSSSSSNSSTVTGTVSSIAVQNGQPYFTMTDSSGKTITDNNGNPLLYSTSQIVGIGN
jgi:flagellar basal-body rod modification protein FlgD